MGSSTSGAAGVVAWGIVGADGDIVAGLEGVGRLRRRGGANRAGSVGTRLCPSQLRDGGSDRERPGGVGRAPDPPAGQPPAASPQTVSTMHRGDLVGVHVGVGATVLEPALLGLGHRPRDADRGAPVRGAVAELGEVGGLVGAGQAALDAHAVDGDVLVDLLPDGLAPGDDGVPAAVLAHGLGGEVGVGAGAVPVTQDGLGLERGVDPEVLGDAEEQPPGHPQVVGDVERREHAHLELPLAHHHLGVGALDADAGVDAGRRVQFDDLAAGHLVAAHAAVVGALGCRVADGRPARAAARP